MQQVTMGLGSASEGVPIKRIVSVFCVLAAFAASEGSAEGAFPGANGKLAFSSNRDGGYDIYVANADGTGVTRIPRAYTYDDSDPAWSPDGLRIASACYDLFLICTMNADGSGFYEIAENGDGETLEPTWSPDGAEVAYARGRMNYCPDPSEPNFCTEQFDLWAVDTGGHGQDRVLTSDINGDDYEPAWSPDGTKIAFVGTCVRSYGCSAEGGIFTIAADGTGMTWLGLRGSHPDWSPDGSKLVYSKRFAGIGEEIMVANASGTGETRLTNDTTDDVKPVWSPDGTRIAFQSKRDGPDFEIHVMNADGTGRQAITDNTFEDIAPDWQPLPPAGYPRPRGATPVALSLVPAFERCTLPNRAHGAPLNFGSCAPPAQSSSDLTVGTPDANGASAESVGFATLYAVAGNSATATDEADVVLQVTVTDVRNSADLTDYAGALEARPTIRITDRSNTPNPSGPGPGTVADIGFPFAVPCSVTSDGTVGSKCAVNTTADAVLAGTVTEGRRSIWQLQDLKVVDSSGDAFQVPGVFVP
jgi:WD40-like Beta Propeller Repeat